MSQKEKTVDHLGRVQEITSTDIVVKILSQSACASCHANGACGMSDSSEKMVVVHKSEHNYTVGQSVMVTLRQSLGFRALLLGYIFPFLLVLFSLITLTAIGISEGKSGLFSLFALVPYYAGLFLLRDKVSKKFTFDIVSI